MMTRPQQKGTIDYTTYTAHSSSISARHRAEGGIAFEVTLPYESC